MSLIVVAMFDRLTVSTSGRHIGANRDVSSRDNASRFMRSQRLRLERFTAHAILGDLTEEFGAKTKLFDRNEFGGRVRLAGRTSTKDVNGHAPNCAITGAVGVLAGADRRAPPRDSLQEFNGPLTEVAIDLTVKPAASGATSRRHRILRNL
jgi:hypothetical protein